MVDARRVGLVGHRVDGGRPVRRGGGGQQDECGSGRPGHEAGQPPRFYRRYCYQREREQRERLDRYPGPGQPGGPVGSSVRQREDAVQQEPDRHRVFRVTPAHRDVPQRGRARGGEQEPLEQAHPHALGERVRGEQCYCCEEGLQRPGDQPADRVNALAARIDRDSGRVHDRRDRDQDHRGAREADQVGGRGVQAGQVQVQEPLGRHQGGPQVVGHRPGRLAVVHRSPDRAGHPDADHHDDRDQRERPPDRPRRRGVGRAGHRGPLTRRAARGRARRPGARPRTTRPARRDRPRG